MAKFKKWVAGFILFSLSLYLLINDDLAFQNYSFNAHAKWDMGILSEKEIGRQQQILNQTFTYLAEGGQTLVFLSDDNRTVLKLFKFKNFTPSIFVKNLPDIFPFKDFKAKHIQKREKRLDAAFSGHKLAFLHHRKESGLIFVQLNSGAESQEVIIKDKYGIKRTLDLKNTPYILQEKGEILSKVMEDLLKKGELIETKNWIDKLFTLYLSEYQKGIYDTDHGIMHNIGCVGQNIIHLDVGSFIEDKNMREPAFFRKDLIKVSMKVKQWLQKRFPEDLEEFTNQLEQKLEQVLNEPIILTKEIL